MVKSHCTRLNRRWTGTILEEGMTEGKGEVLKTLGLNLEKTLLDSIMGRKQMTAPL